MDQSALRRSLGPLALFLLAGHAAAQAPFSDLSLDDAKAIVEDEDRILVVYFHQPNDPESKRMESQVFGDPEVRTWIEQFGVALRYEYGDRQPIQRFGITAWPTTLLLGKEGKLLHRMQYYRPPSEFLVAANTAVLSLGDVTRPDGAQSENPMAWLAWGNHLFNNDSSRADEALEAYLWCLDKGEDHLTGFRQMHLEFLLERIAYLKPHTLKAVEALLNRRTDKGNQVVSQEGTTRDVEEFMRFCYWLRDPNEALILMDSLLQNDDEHSMAMALELMRLDLGQLAAFKRYDDILRLDSNPYAHIDARLSEWEAQVAAEDVEPEEGLRAKIVLDAAFYFEALVATGRGGDGMELAQRVLAAVPTGRAYRLFMEKTNRHELFELTKRLAAEGMERVEGAGRQMIEAELGRAVPKDEEKGEPAVNPLGSGDGQGGGR